MSRTASVASSTDALLGQVADEFFAAMSRDERPTISEFAERYPEIAEHIRRAFPALLLVGSSSTDPELDGLPPCGDGTKTLGDFRLIRELGRGGMGTVFEAEQLSMGRRVALKVLPFAAISHNKSLQRFHNEVRAAAALDHPHIVSVYSIGEERGVHFYAMQLIRGRTLAELIAELRTARQGHASAAGGDRDHAPTIDSSFAEPPSTMREEQARLSTAADSRQVMESYRTAARLGIEAAAALQHAHDQGVLHRDIKPGNLMLDGGGKLYVTDFGLARIEADAGLTMTGDIIGTLRYMAPEQALAKRVVIDHRADVYSLGATIYELLTLQPAFAETDRSELLKQIAFEEPRPLRKLDRRIPAELETIVLKAMSKSVDERYQTAQRLADDLRAFLESRPIKAKPPTLVGRATKWSRRHRPLVVSAALSAAALLVMGVVMLIISNAQIRKESVAKAAALLEKDAALAKAREAVNQMLMRVADEKLINVPMTEPLRKALLEDALRFYEGFLQQAQTDPTIRLEMANVLRRVCNIQREMGHGEDARETQQRCIEMLQSLMTSDPGEPIYREQLAEAHTYLAYIISSTLTGASAVEEQETQLREALRLYAGLKHDFPERPQASGGCVGGLGSIMRDRGNLIEAERLYREAIAQVESYLQNAPLYPWRMRIADRIPQEASDMLHAIDPSSQLDLCWARFTLAGLLEKSGPEPRLDEAERLYRQAIDAVDAGLKTDPRSQAFRFARACINESLGSLCQVAGRTDEATSFYRESLQEAQSLVRQSPADKNFWGKVSEDENALVRLLRSSGRTNDTKAAIAEMWGWTQEITPDIPNVPELQTELLKCVARVANDSRLTGQTEQADKASHRAIELLASIPAPDVNDLTKTGQYVMNRAIVYGKLGRYDDEMAEYERAIAINPDDATAHNNFAWILATMADDNARNGKRAVDLATKACELTEYKDAGFVDTLAAAYAEAGDFESAVKWSEKSVELDKDNKLLAQHLETFRGGKPWREP